MRQLKRKIIMEKESKNLAYWKANASEDYVKTPISVLRYITQLESALSMLGVVGLREQLLAWEKWKVEKGKYPEYRTKEQMIDDYLSQ